MTFYQLRIRNKRFAECSPFGARAIATSLSRNVLVSVWHILKHTSSVNRPYHASINNYSVSFVIVQSANMLTEVKNYTPLGSFKQNRLIGISTFVLTKFHFISWANVGNSSDRINHSIMWI